MITKMTGILNRVLDEDVRLQVGPFEYQVLIPEFVRRQVQMKAGGEVTFHVLEYIEGGQNSSRWTPRPEPPSAALATTTCRGRSTRTGTPCGSASTPDGRDGASARTSEIVCTRSSGSGTQRRSAPGSGSR